MILAIGPRLEGHLPIFSAIQTHPSCRFLPAVDFPGLRRSGSSPEIIDQAQDFPEQFSRHRHLRQLERGIATMAHDLRADLDELLAQRSVANALLPPIRLTSPLGQRTKPLRGSLMPQAARSGD